MGINRKICLCMFLFSIIILTTSVISATDINNTNYYEDNSLNDFSSNQIEKSVNNNEQIEETYNNENDLNVNYEKITKDVKSKLGSSQTTVSLESSNKVTSGESTTIKVNVTSGKSVTNGRVSITFNNKWIGSPGVNNGIATMTYIVPSEFNGVYPMTMTYIDSNNQTIITSSSNINVLKSTNKIQSIISDTAFSNTDMLIKASVTDLNNTKTTGGRVSITFNNKWIGSPGVNNGIATMTYTIPNNYNGTYPIKMTYIDTQNREVTTNTKKITILKPTNKIQPTIPNTAFSNTDMLIKASVTDLNNTKTTGGRVSITFNNKWIGSPGVNNGIATMTYTIPNNYNGTYTIKMTYIDTQNREVASTTKNIIITKPTELDINLTTTVENKTIDLVYDTWNEVAISKNITTVNGKPDVTKLGVDYAYADENGVYTILGEEIRRVMKLDSFCQQVYGFVPKYTFFRQLGSNVKYIISREKWNVIARSLNSYHVNQHYTAVSTPYSITVNLSNQKNYYPIYYDAQEWINGHQYTCGPTAMSMISQSLNSYSSERRLAEVYSTTSQWGTDEVEIIRMSPSVQMKLTDITDNKNSVQNALLSGKMVFWHIRGHYMCIVGYNQVNDKFLCLNPSGPSHRINAVQWATWTEIMNTDRPLKENGFMAVTPYRDLNASDKIHAQFYYYNMGGKYTVPNNSEYPNSSINSLIKVTVDKPQEITKTNKTTLNIKSDIKINSKTISMGKVEVYLNGKLIGTKNVNNSKIELNYTLPAYTDNQVKIEVRYIYLNYTSTYVVNNFYKYSAGNSFNNITKIKIE